MGEILEIGNSANPDKFIMILARESRIRLEIKLANSVTRLGDILSTIWATLASAEYMHVRRTLDLLPFSIYHPI